MATETPTVQFVFDDYALLVFDDHEGVEPGEYSGQDLAEIATPLGHLQIRYANDKRFEDLFHGSAILLYIIIE